MRKQLLRAHDAPVEPRELKQWRRARAWTQEKASAQLGVSLKAYQNWEQGCRSMRHPVAIRKLMGQSRPRREAP